ncbi:hypothetical protein [Luteipulveratus halotolerans]|uniref:Uncharacterized protein n=1 Tax=Luteipulveratus halotolerans TaxID=1631356 RepID=A0A0L6CDY4_9MICO|nr:hypothetical protein [Luteipulveratus halotolerans]KNX36081.1 hypothetical protein VV01_01225 [Luteipulveratus halotolerans]
MKVIDRDDLNRHFEALLNDTDRDESLYVHLETGALQSRRDDLRPSRAEWALLAREDLGERWGWGWGAEWDDLPMAKRREEIAIVRSEIERSPDGEYQRICDAREFD